MIFSQDTEAVLRFLDSIEGVTFRKGIDLGYLLESGAITGRADIFNDIVHTGTAVWKIYSTLRRLTSGAEGYNNLEREFGLMINKLREEMATLIDGIEDDETNDRFENIYFGMTQGVIRNLVDLSHDLSHIKRLQTDSRSKDESVT